MRSITHQGAGQVWAAGGKGDCLDHWPFRTSSRELRGWGEGRRRSVRNAGPLIAPSRWRGEGASEPPTCRPSLSLGERDGQWVNATKD